ncbi:hypothetical protein [Spirosoma agri]|uniref:Porin family protein n=1 Tax=Spirosoma agri TaxID=1987381 RepID=A0A6M0ID32_9BACT|nr:hypothetical protein [Spirosoma agri]NEU66149.1 hypothetical protein [Spirosoma agri]
MKTALLLCVVLFPAFGQAQRVAQKEETQLSAKPFARKTWQIGIQSGYSKATFLARNLSNQLHGGYFIADKLMLGLSAGQSLEWSQKNIVTNTISVGPALRYHLTRTRLSPFIAGSYRFGQYTYSGENASVSSGSSGTRIYSGHSTLNIHARSLTAGLSVGLSSALRADIALNWQDVINPNREYAVSGNSLLQAQVGVNYSFGTR